MSHLSELSRAIPRSRLLAGLVLLILTSALVPTVYTGVSGPYYFDSAKLTPVTDWVTGSELDVFDTAPINSRMFGRVLGLATFVAEGRLSGGKLEPRITKSVNVGIHLACAVALFLLLRHLVSMTPYRGHAALLALLATAVWTLSPTNLGTAFYAVQRLAQLASLFIIIGLLSYTAMRSRPRGPLTTVGFLALYLASLVAAIACKEIGFNLVLYTLVIELFFFRFRNPWITPKHLGVAIVTAVFVLGLSILYLKPEYIGYYDIRPFTMSERVLTQLRVIPMYIGDLLLPSEHSTGLYKQVEHSTGLFSPITTLFGMFALLAYCGLTGLLYYTGFRFVAFGLVFFAVGHAMESSIIPLELHFRHRNYLPSAGLYLTLTLAGYELARHLHRKPLLALIACLYLVFMGSASYARATAWSSKLEMGASAYRYNPESYRAVSTYARLLARAGQVNQTFTLLDRQIADYPDNDFIFRIQRLYYACVFDRPIPAGTYTGIANADVRAPEVEVSSVLKVLSQSGFNDGNCSEVAVPQLVDALGAFAESQHKVTINPWYVHYYRARILLDTGHDGDAFALLEQLVEKGYSDAGLMLADLHLREGNQDKANAILDQVADDMSLDSINRFGISEDRLDRQRGVIIDAE